MAHDVTAVLRNEMLYYTVANDVTALGEEWYLVLQLMM